MCEKRKNGNAPSGTIDPCMREEIKALNVVFNTFGFMKIVACCGHGKYPRTIILETQFACFDMESWTTIPRKKRFYKKDSECYYYIPEISKTPVKTRTRKAQLSSSRKRSKK